MMASTGRLRLPKAAQHISKYARPLHTSNGPVCLRCRSQLHLINTPFQASILYLPLRSSQHHARFASTTTTETAPPLSSYILFTLRRLRALILGTTLLLSLPLAYYYLTDTRSSIHSLTPRLLSTLFDAESSHKHSVTALRMLHALNLHPRERPDPLSPSSSSSTYPSSSAFDLTIPLFSSPTTFLPSPLGISAGLDKDGEIPDALFALGASVVEIGGCTPLPQGGNPTPRVWRIESQDALINRYGLNSCGADALARVLRGRVRAFARKEGWGVGEEGERRVLDGVGADGYGDGDERSLGGEAQVGGGWMPGSLARGKMLAVQIAKNARTDANDVDAVARDYVYCVDRVGKYADILVVNVSSPNTPGLRGLQQGGPLTKILTEVVSAVGRVDRRTKPRVMVKVSPDEDSEMDVRGICAAVVDAGVDGVVVANTTKSRPLPPGARLSASEVEALNEQGGFSGPSMYAHTRSLVYRYRYFLDGMMGPTDDRLNPPKMIFASGGIDTGAKALGVLEAGASIAMMYTGLVYGGAGTVTRMKGELREEMRRRMELQRGGTDAQKVEQRGATDGQQIP